MILGRARVLLNTGRRYKLYNFKEGIWKVCGKFEAQTLMSQGCWADKTEYNLNEEVLNYGDKKNGNAGTSNEVSKRENICGRRVETTSEGYQPQHEQHHPDLCDSPREEHKPRKLLRSGTEGSEIVAVKKRGRPKR